MDHVYLNLISQFGILLVALFFTHGRDINRSFDNAAGNTTKQSDLQSTGRSKNILKIGWVLPYSFYCEDMCNEQKPSTGNTYAAAFKIAVEQINRNKSLLPNHRIEFVYSDSRLKENETITAVYRQLEYMNVTALVGFGWFCHSISQIASGVNVPVISYACDDDDTFTVHQSSDAGRGLLFARTYPLNAQVVPNLVAILRHFNWNKIVLLKNAEINPFQLKGNMEIAENFLRYKVEIVHEEALPASIDISATNEVLMKIMQTAKNKCRVIVFMSEYPVAREALVNAHKLGMTNGEYVFIIVIMSPVTFETNIQHPFQWFVSAFSYDDTSSEEAVREAFNTTLLVGPTINEDDMKVKQFVRNLKEESAKPPFNSSFYSKMPSARIPDEAYYLYDSVLLYALAVNETIATNRSIENGTEIYNSLKGMTYQSSLGHKMTVHEVSNKGMFVRFNYKVYMAIKNGSKDVIQHKADLVQKDGAITANETDMVYVEVKEIDWPKGIPSDCPLVTTCKDGSCKKKDKQDTLVIILSVSISIVVVILVLLPLFKYRNYRLERSLNSKLWEINIDELEFTDRCLTPVISTTNLENIESEASPSPQRRKSFKVTTLKAAYRMESVAIKSIEGHTVELKRETLLELNQMREICHDNINHFIGAFIKPGRVIIVSQLALRGSLEDVLEDRNIKLETLFLLSLIYDIIKGMTYLHSSEFRSHGALKSSNCVIDSRWVLKITDFGLHSLKIKKSAREYREQLDSRSHLWVAPELLRDPNPPPQGTPKGDVYSFAIILQECHTRLGPWSDEDLTCEEIVSRVENVEDPPFRPIVSIRITNAAGLHTMMKACWNETPHERPSFPELGKELSLMMKENGMKSNLVDNMMYMMEQYARDLENRVEEKNGQLSIEKKRIEALVERMLPKKIFKQLKQGKDVEAETFDEVTIYFSDIAGFTSLCAESTAMEVVQFLNQLYTMFDNIIKYYDVYKVETIGDAYMVVSGLPKRNGRNHAKEICLMALHLRNAVKSFVIHHKRDKQLQIRIGIHSGSVVTGVVGSTMPRYCLFGDAVNTASRMESTGEPLKIHISGSTKEILDEINGFNTRLRGDLAVKGKGVLTTYWLDDVGEKWQPSLAKFQSAELLTRVQTVPQNSPQLSHPQLRFARGSPANSLCASPATSPTLLRKGSRYRCRKEGTIELELNLKHLSRTNSKNTPIEEKDPLFSTA